MLIVNAEKKTNKNEESEWSERVCIRPSVQVIVNVCVCFMKMNETTTEHEVLTIYGV